MSNAKHPQQGKAESIHDNKYDYSLVESWLSYSHNRQPIICPKHGVFVQQIGSHLMGHGCPQCASKSASNKALTWLDYIQEQTGVVIQHAGNESEYNIPGTRLFVDGYCAETNTVYEFDGDAFHGNPSRYAPDHLCHPFDKTVTASMLYEKTKQKHQTLRDMGYNVVTIWESDFDKLNIPVNSYTDINDSRVDSTYPEKMLEMGLEIIGPYEGAKVKHTFRCLLCGGTHEATPVAKQWVKKRRPHVYGCPECNAKTRTDKNRSRGNYVARLEALGYTVEGYKNARVKVWLTCTTCGKRKFVTPSAVIQNSSMCCSEEK